MRYQSESPEETYEIGRRLGSEAAPGSVYALVGDLGAGKTIFTKGFAAGLGISDTITSPTFTIMQVYEGGRLPLYHFDVYRISDPEEMYEIGFDEYILGDGVSLIEWADRIPELLPKETVKITIKRDSGRGENVRILDLN